MNINSLPAESLPWDSPKVQTGAQELNSENEKKEILQRGQKICMYWHIFTYKVKCVRRWTPDVSVESSGFLGVKWDVS